MDILSVSVAVDRTLSFRGREVPTGIFKQPVPGRVMVHGKGLDGDRQADLTVHGGIYKAVYVYPVEHYEAWARELDRNDLAYGQFGENLTVAGMTEELVHIGDVFRMGETLLQVTQPRLPCYKLAVKMGSMKFPKRFLASGRVGYYLRVLERGTVAAGDRVNRVELDESGVTVGDILGLAFTEPVQRVPLERALAIPALSPEWRVMLEERLVAG